jgi:Cysteine rich repeat
MSKLRFAVVVLAVGFSSTGFAPSTAFAQRLTADQRAACKPDFQKLCGDVKPGGGRIMECLNGKYDQLSDDCKKVVDSRKKQ